MNKSGSKRRSEGNKSRGIRGGGDEGKGSRVVGGRDEE